VKVFVLVYLAVVFILLVPLGAQAAPSLSSADVARIASGFCAVVGAGKPQVVRVVPPPRANVVAVGSHHWRPLWRVTMVGGASVEVADVSGIVVGFKAGMTGGRPGNVTTPNPETLIRRATTILDATGQKRELAESPELSTSADYSEDVLTWHRVWKEIPYVGDAVVIAFDSTSGELSSLFVNFTASPPRDIEEAVTAQQAVDYAEAALRRAVGGVPLQTLPPERVVVPVAATAHSPSVSRVSWHCRFAASTGQQVAAYVDIQSGEVFRIVK